MIYLIMFVVFLLIILARMLFKSGQNAKSNEIMQDNSDIQREMEKVKVNDINKVKDAIKKGLFILVLVLFTSCIKRNVISTVCPKPVDYSLEFQQKLVEDLDKYKSIYYNQIVLDFYNINQQLRACNGK